VGAWRTGWRAAVGVWRSGKRAAMAHAGETLEGVGVGTARLVRDEQRICIWRAGASTSRAGSTTPASLFVLC